MRKDEHIVNFVILIAALCIIAKSLTYQAVYNGTPGPGFLPLMIGILAAVLVLSQVISNLRYSDKRSAESSTLTRADFKPFVVFLGSSVLFVILTPLIGLLISLGLMSGFTTWFFGGKKLYVILVTILTPLFTYLIFIAFLGVFLPDSIIGI
jgi:hypothetical protein